MTSPLARADRVRQYPGLGRSRILRRKAVRPRHSVAGLRSGWIVPLRPYARAMALGDATLVRDPELRDRIAHLPVASAGQLVSQEPAGATAARPRAAPVASAEASLGLRGRCAHVQKSSPIPGCPGGSTKKNRLPFKTSGILSRLRSVCKAVCKNCQERRRSLRSVERRPKGLRRAHQRRISNAGRRIGSMKPILLDGGTRSQPRARVLETPMLPLHQSPKSALLQAFCVCRMARRGVGAQVARGADQLPGPDRAWPKDTRGLQPDDGGATTDPANDGGATTGAKAGGTLPGQRPRREPQR